MNVRFSIFITLLSMQRDGCQWSSYVLLILGLAVKANFAPGPSRWPVGMKSLCGVSFIVCITGILTS